MKFGSVCSGIEAASVAWHPLGWTAAWLSEIEPFPCAVLKHHYPDVPNHGDMTLLPEKILSGQVEAPDLFCGGTPCQAFSVAGLRNSLDDARGNLSLTFVGIANAIDHVRSLRGDAPAIVFWENVPGVLNTKDNAFGCFLGALAGESEPITAPGERWSNAGCVFGPQRTVAWRVLDAQYFGVAQRRRRVFVVASARDDINPAEILFEFDGLRRDIAQSRKEGQEIAGTTASRFGISRNNHKESVATSVYENHPADSRVKDMGEVCSTVVSRWGTGGGNLPIVSQPIPFDTTQITSASNYSKPQAGDPCHPLASGAHPPAIAQPVGIDSYNLCETGNLTQTLKSPQGGVTESIGAVRVGMAVRRLTPVECERLQGFPDGYTNIPWRKAAESPDGPRYKALGNSWAVPAVAWTGKRIQEQLK
jgi:DNA (cytosine-5)-methyltransferase 1